MDPDEKKGYHIGVFDRSKDIEGLAGQIYDHMFPDRDGWGKETDDWLKDRYRDCAKSVSEWMWGLKPPSLFGRRNK